MTKQRPAPLQTYTEDLSRFYIMDLRTNEVFDIPFPPTDLTERTNSPAYSSDTVVGRTSQYMIYTSSSNRTVGVQFAVIDDYIEIGLEEARDILASMAMPRYNNYNIEPPRVQIKLGAMVLRGVISSISFTWSGVFRNGLYTVLNVTMELTEARQIPLGSTEVRAGGWKNG
jgi:hypothetical protein